MDEQPKISLLGRLKNAFVDSVEFAAGRMEMLQIQFMERLLSSVIFVFLLFVMVLLAIGSFVLLNVGIGIWLAHVTGSAVWSALILGVAYFILTGVAAFAAVYWIKRIKRRTFR